MLHSLTKIQLIPVYLKYYSKVFKIHPRCIVGSKNSTIIIKSNSSPALSGVTFALSLISVTMKAIYA